MIASGKLQAKTNLQRVQSDVFTQNIADALMLLYKSVKERKVREFVKEMENGGVNKYGRYKGNISL